MAHIAAFPQQPHDEPAGDEVSGGEDDLSKAVAAWDPGPRGREENPCEQRRVAVGLACIGAFASSYRTRGVGEDEVVDVGVLEGRIGVLPEAVEEEDEAQEGGDKEEGGWLEQRAERRHGWLRTSLQM